MLQGGVMGKGVGDMEEEKKWQKHALCAPEPVSMQTPKLGGDLNTTEGLSYVHLCKLFVGLEASNVIIFYLHHLTTARVPKKLKRPR